jgi:eukaryotic-like serine/threonine-protein kinase
VSKTDTVPPGHLPDGTPDGSSEANTIKSDGKPHLEAEPPLPPQTTLAGRYVVFDELGRGGMGIVYRARDRQLGRPVALKVLQRRLSDDADLRERFLEEARVTAQLQHPSIVPVFDVGSTDDGLIFYTMRLVEGRDMCTLAEEGWTLEPRGDSRWTLFRALDAFVQVCRALGYAHDRGFVHRDIKPSNCMVGRWGEVHVLDWGLAKAVGWAPAGPPPAPETIPRGDEERAGTRVITRTGSVLGTPAYMAPEQAMGHPLDARADVYALGGVLYTLLCARLPHEGTTSQVMWKVTWGIPPAPPSGARPDVPAALDAICMRALSHARDERFASALAMADAVEDYLLGRPTGPVRAEDAEFLRSYRPTEFRRPSVTVDLVIVHAPAGATPRVLLHRRTRAPFRGRWALPGSFVRLEDDLEVAARRTLWNETGIGAPDLALQQVGAFGEPGRDPRTRVITIAWMCVLDTPAPPPVTTPPEEGDDARWFRVIDTPDGVRLEDERDALHEPAFDHGAILLAAMKGLPR